MTLSYKSKEDFYQFIMDNDVIGIFDKSIKLKSGRLSYFYVNWRNIASNVFLIDKLTDYIISFAEELNLQLDCFIGVPEGATKLGILTQYKWAKRQKDFKSKKYILPMARGKIKKHGDPKDKAYIGVPMGNIVILEDVTTTGESLLKLINQLLELNVKITATISLTNRNEIRPDGRTIEEILKEKEISYYAMSNALDLLPNVYEKYNIDKSIARKVEKYFEQYGVNRLKLLE
jgi:orotate phosphoribosyltransferase